MTEDFLVGTWRVQPTLNRVHSAGGVRQIEPKVMKVLCRLARTPGDVVSRDVLLDEIWGRDAATDYPLSRAISELRRIFDDDAASPEILETIRKSGYRLIAPVRPAPPLPPTLDPPSPDFIQAPPPLVAGATPPEALEAFAYQGAEDLRDRSGWTSRGPRYAIGGVGILAVGLLGVLISRSIRAKHDVRAAGIVQSLPLTSFPGREVDPALSPAGDRVAFAWARDTGTFAIYVKPVGSEDATPIATSPNAMSRYPTWSPDGTEIAFARGGGDCGIYVASSKGGDARRLTQCDEKDIQGTSWSPNGEWIAYAARPSAEQPTRILLVSARSGERRVLTQPAPATIGDFSPRFGPDGHTLAFVRSNGDYVMDVYATDIDVQTSAGSPAPLKRLTFDGRKVYGFDWSPRGTQLVYASNRTGVFALWKVSTDGGQPMPALGGDDDARYPAASRTGVDVAFVHALDDLNIWRIAVTGDSAARSETPLVASTRWDESPRYSPDGSHIAFMSTRSGPPEIWIADADGSHARPVTSFGGPLAQHPSWSPDGKHLALDARVDGHADVYIVDVESGTTKRVTSDSSDHLRPSWSADGRIVYFSSNRDGGWQIWKVPFDGGDATRVTDGGGTTAVESADGKTLYFTKRGASGLWQKPVSGGAERVATQLLTENDWQSWALVGRNVYFLHWRQEQGILARFSLDSLRVSTLARLDAGYVNAGLSISPDERWAVLVRVDKRGESDLKVVRNFW